MALINYTGKNVLGVCTKEGEIIRFLPGINEIGDEQLKLVKAHPLFQSRMNRGLVQIMLENLGSDGKRPVQEMLTNIPKIFDSKLLKKIIDTDGRERVVKAAEQQLDNIKNPKKRESENDEHFA